MISWEAWDRNVRNIRAYVVAIYCFIEDNSRVMVKLKIQLKIN